MTPQTQLWNAMINLTYVVAGNMPGAPEPIVYNSGARRFAETYVQHPPDYEHRLFLIDSNGGLTDNVASLFKGIKYEVIPYRGSGWDIGAQSYAALTMLPEDWMMAFSSWAHFRRRGWLKDFAKARDEHGDGLYASTVSFENSPHVRGTGYFLRCGRFQRYPYGINSRIETFKWEWGPNSLTKWFIREGYGVWLVTPNGTLSIDDAHNMTNGFRNGDQSNIWTFDKHTDLFEQAGAQEKQSLATMAWGPQSDSLAKGIQILLHPLFRDDFSDEIRSELLRLIESEKTLREHPAGLINIVDQTSDLIPPLSSSSIDADQKTPEVKEENTFNYRGFDIPIDLLNMTGGGVDSFEAISDGHIKLLREMIKLDARHNVLEIGCGIGRDAIPLTSILYPDSNYTGIDFIGRSISWCKENISSKHHNFSFFHFDVEDQLHNPAGTRKTTDFQLPCADESIDRVILWSVFAHMKADDIVYYLKEFRRVLKPEGMVFATFFFINDEIIASAQATNRTIFHLRFEHPYGDGCFVNDIVHPMGAVAYTVPKIRQIVELGGLSFRYPILFGSWSGIFPPSAFDAGQDAVVLFKN